MANQQFIQPGRMASQFVPTDVISVMYQATGVNAPVTNGLLAVLGDLYIEPVYTSAYGANVADLNTRIATLPGSDTVAGVGIIDIATVPTVANSAGTNTYRIGTQTTGLVAEAGTPVRFRKLYVDDTLFTSIDNFTSAPTVGQYAIVDSATGNWKPSATQPATGLVAKVVFTGKALTQGIDPTLTQTMLLIVQIA